MSVAVACWADLSLAVRNSKLRLDSKHLFNHDPAFAQDGHLSGEAGWRDGHNPGGRAGPRGCESWCRRAAIVTRTLAG